MIIKLLFIILLLLILKLFIIRFDFFDYFNITLSCLFVLFSYLYIIYGGVYLIIFIITTFISLIIYSFYHFDSSNSSLIIINGHIIINNMIKNKYSITSLYSDLKKNNISFLNRDICAVLNNKKLVFYTKEEVVGKPRTIIIDGKICFNELYMIGKGVKWLNRMIINNDTDIKDIFYSFYYNNKLYIIKK